MGNFNCCCERDAKNHDITVIEHYIKNKEAQKDEILPSNICSQHKLPKEFYCIKKLCQTLGLNCFMCLNHHDSSHKTFNKIPIFLLSKYEILEFLGMGGFGVVFKVKNPLKNQCTALKIIEISEHLKLGTTKDKYIEMIKSDIILHKRITHRNIIEYYDSIYYEQENVWLIEMELAQSSLNSYFKLEEKEAQTMFLEICEGVEYLHQNNIFHGELKPENILIKIENDKKIPKIADFVGVNLLKFFQSQTKESLRGGISAYLPPENLKNLEVEFNQSSDIWALGIIYHQMLVGSHPFSKPIQRKVLQNKKSISKKIKDCNKDIISGNF